MSTRIIYSITTQITIVWQLDRALCAGGNLPLKKERQKQEKEELTHHTYKTDRNLRCKSVRDNKAKELILS